LAPPYNFKRQFLLGFNNYLRSALTLREVSSGRDVWRTGTRRAEFLPCRPKSLVGRAVLDVCGAHTTIEASGMLDHLEARPQLTPLGDQVRPSYGGKEGGARQRLELLRESSGTSPDIPATAITATAFDELSKVQR
jgi:hypothetical protein